MQRRILALGLVVLLAPPTAGQEGAQEKPGSGVISLREGILCQFSGGRIVGADDRSPAVRVSDDMTRVAAVIREPDGRFAVGVNGKKGNAYLGIIPPEGAPLAQAIRFSEDFTRFGYVAEAPKGKVVVIDQKESEPYDLVMDAMPLFSPDSSRVAYAMALKGKIYMMVDGQRSQALRDLQVGSLSWSPDSERLAFCAKEGDDWQVFVHEYERKKKTPANRPGARAFPAIRGISRDGVVFSRDSSRVGYAAQSTNNKWFVMVDGKPVNPVPYDEVGVGSFSFSRDSKHYAYAASLARAWYVFVDGKPCAVGDRLVGAQALAEGTPRFSEDSSRIVFAVDLQGTWSVVLHEVKESTKPFVTGAEVARGQEILEGTPRFARDGQVCVYAVRKPNGWWVGSEGKEWGPYEGIKKRSLLVSPDGTRVAFVGTRKGRFAVVLNGKDSENLYDKVGQPRFSREKGTNTVVVSASRGRAWVTLVNGEEKYRWYQGILADETGEQTTPDATVVSPDGKRVSFYAVLFGKWALCIDGMPLKMSVPYTYRFSPDTNLLEAVLWDPETPMIFRSLREVREAR